MKQILIKKQEQVGKCIEQIIRRDQNIDRQKTIQLRKKVNPEYQNGQYNFGENYYYDGDQRDLSNVEENDGYDEYSQDQEQF